jgi:predicted HTH transcriptional regulator
VNALVHRSLNWKVPIRIFIFDDRAEIHSPGTLPNGLSVDDIIAGTSMPRNNFLFSMLFICYLTPVLAVAFNVH